MWKHTEPQENRLNDYLAENPYDSFMKKHLQHYGYYTGRNEHYRKTIEKWAEYEKNHAFSDDDSDSDYVNEAISVRGEEKDEDFLRTTQLVYSQHDNGKMVARLREPRELYAMAGDGPQQAAKWPIELEVIPERVHHITYLPDKEPLYKPTGTESMPMARGEMGGKVVYLYEPMLGPFFLRSRVGGNRKGLSDVSVRLESPSDDTLLFEARFESGNLEKAIKIGPYEYELYLRPDLYTSKHIQWFYFRVSNTRANKMYRFTIVNFYKSDSLYNEGMRPLSYSEKDATQKKIGWRRCGTSIRYYRNNLRYSTTKGDRAYYSLTWSCSFSHDQDTVYFAHCYPYLYTDLQDYLMNVMNDPAKSKICKQRVLCRTLAGNIVYVLTITNPLTDGISQDEYRSKKAVVVTGRVHPGESNASWMMKGFLDYLTADLPDAKLLRDKFIFKVIPMLNPDGVIVGNYRCSLAGRDLNRNYKTVLKESFPTVWHTKALIQKLVEEREVVAYCDLHGHSRRQNVFIYGCENKESPESRLKERIFPAMLSKNANNKFHFESCRFKVQKNKEQTGRIVMWNMGINNSYTMEATFCGSTLGDLDGYHFSTSDYEAMGYHFCDTLLDYCDPDPAKSVSLFGELEDKFRREILIRLQTKDPNVSISDINLAEADLSEMESSDGGSDSSVSDGLPVHYEYMKSKMPQKKKKLKTKKELDTLVDSSTKEGRCCSKLTSAPTVRKTACPVCHCYNCSQQIGSRPGSRKAPVSIRRTSSSQSIGERMQSAPAADSGQQVRCKSSQNLAAIATKDKVDTVEEDDSLTNGVQGQNRQNQEAVRVNLRYVVQGGREGAGVLRPGILAPVEHLCPHHERQMTQQVAGPRQDRPVADVSPTGPRATSAGSSGAVRPSQTGRMASLASGIEGAGAQTSSRPSTGLSRQQKPAQKLSSSSTLEQRSADQIEVKNPRLFSAGRPSSSRRPRSVHGPASSSSRYQPPVQNFVPQIIQTATRNSLTRRPGLLNRLDRTTFTSTSQGIQPSLGQFAPSAREALLFGRQQEIQTTLDSIQEIRESIQEYSKSGFFSPDTRRYVADLLAATDREIEELTAVSSERSREHVELQTSSVQQPGHHTGTTPRDDHVGDRPSFTQKHHRLDPIQQQHLPPGQTVSVAGPGVEVGHAISELISFYQQHTQAAERRGSCESSDVMYPLSRESSMADFAAWKGYSKPQRLAGSADPDTRQFHAPKSNGALSERATASWPIGESDSYCPHGNRLTTPVGVAAEPNNAVTVRRLHQTVESEGMDGAANDQLRRPRCSCCRSQNGVTSQSQGEPIPKKREKKPEVPVPELISPSRIVLVMKDVYTKQQQQRVLARIPHGRPPLLRRNFRK